MRVLTVLGARPQFIKAAPVSLELNKVGIEEFILHSGQHYSDKMSSIFFRELLIPDPYKNLEIGSGTHAEQTGKVMIGVEKELNHLTPDYLIVYGDTNTTLGSALAACKLNIPVVHIEAGLRSYNRQMPEEHNRVLVDHISSLLICPSYNAVSILKSEGITNGVHFVGDTMLDAVKMMEQSLFLDPRFNVKVGEYYLATIHRPYNTDNLDNLTEIIKGFNGLDKTVLFPIHPRAYKQILDCTSIKLSDYNNIMFLEPLGYIDMLSLLKFAHRCITDSGGLQKEAYYVGTPCITIRPETEWVELLKINANVLCEPNALSIVNTCLNHKFDTLKGNEIYGDGNSSKKIAEIINGL